MRTLPFLFTLLLVPTISFAQASGATVDAALDPAGSEIPEGVGTITIEQVAIKGVLGSWILSLPDHSKQTGTEATTTIADTPSGNYTVYGILPSGMKPTIRIYRNGVQDQFYERQQAPFILNPGENVRIVIHYHLDKTGIVSVQSDPEGTVFTLTGPDGLSFAGVTPETYSDLPEGQYKVQYESFAEGCHKPAPKAGQLVEDGRVTFDLQFDCAAATKVRARQNSDSTTKRLMIIVDGEELELFDVQQKDWFSTYVFEAAKRNILSGYRDLAGRPTGEFGPGNSVTIAELTKIAHKLAGLSEDAFKSVSPRNPAFFGHWYAPFLASSENRGWTIFASDIDPSRAATRGEVVVTLLQAFDIPLKWQKGNVFTDVSVLHPYAAAIETAAADEIVSGRNDTAGKSTGTFDPDATITRAEIAKIITTILDTYTSPTTLRNAAERDED